eukprot:2304610-Ditylum_brightwellii.AAC.1
MSQAEPESVMHIALSPDSSSLSDGNVEAASNDVYLIKKDHLGMEITSSYQVTTLWKELSSLIVVLDL